MKIERYYTKPNILILSELSMRQAYSEDGKEFLLPISWSDIADDFLLDNIFCKEKISPSIVEKKIKSLPRFLVPNFSTIEDFANGYEQDFRWVMWRICGSITANLQQAGLFIADADAENFYNELLYIFINRIATLDIKLLSHIGVNWAYGLDEDNKSLDIISDFAVNRDNAFRYLKLKAEELAIDNNAQAEAIVFPIDKSDIVDFINWKHSEEIDIAALKCGKNIITEALHLVIDACNCDSIFGFDPNYNKNLSTIIEQLQAQSIGNEFINLALRYAEQGYEEINLNLNQDISPVSDKIKSYISIDNEFIEAALTNGSFKNEAGKHIDAQALFENIITSIWACGEPNLIFRDNVNNDNIDNSPVQISAGGGFLFKASSSAPKAAINLFKLYNKQNMVDMVALEHLTILLTLALDSLVSDKEHRPIALGFTNMAELLMANACIYDSNKSRAFASLITAFISGVAYKTSYYMAKRLGAFHCYSKCQKNIENIIKSKADTLNIAVTYNKDIGFGEFKNHILLTNSKNIWSEVLSFSKDDGGFRNAYLTSVDTDYNMQIILGGSANNIAPLASLTTSADREFFADKINPCILQALSFLQYSEEQIENICMHILSDRELVEAIDINPEHIEIFDTLGGFRKIKPATRIKMQAAVEKFLSGTVVNVIELNHHTNIDEIKELIINAWGVGVKVLRLYRDRCSLLSPAIIDTDKSSKEIADRLVESSNSDIAEQLKV